MNANTAALIENVAETTFANTKHNKLVNADDCYDDEDKKAAEAAATAEKRDSVVKKVSFSSEDQAIGTDYSDSDDFEVIDSEKEADQLQPPATKAAISAAAEQQPLSTALLKPSGGGEYKELARLTANKVGLLFCLWVYYTFCLNYDQEILKNLRWYLNNTSRDG